MIEQDDMLIVDCKNMSKFGTIFAQTYHVAVLNNVYVEFHHYDVALPLDFQCKYPEIIEHGLSMKWSDLLGK